MKTIELIHECIKEETVKFFNNEIESMNTDEIARKVNASRTITSKYLNEMVKTGDLIKIISRPVMFFDRRIVENLKNIVITQYEFISIDEFNKYIESVPVNDGFESLIGNSSSLNESVIKLKANAKYPSDVIAPIIISGERGTGKKYIAKCFFNYLKTEGMIDKDKKFYVFNCNKETTDYVKQLFGSGAKDNNKKGYLEMAKDTVLYINNSEYLDKNSQYKLASYLENGLFFNMAEKKFEKLKVHIIFSAINCTNDTFCTRLMDTVSLKIKLPPIEDRTQLEKEKLIHKALSEEEKHLSRHILISNFTFNALVKYKYKNNIDGIINAIKTTCANANYSSDKGNDEMIILSYHLPENIMQLCIDEDITEDKHMFCLDDIKNNLLLDKILFYYDDILEKYLEYKNGKISENDFIKCIREILVKYSDYIIFEKKINNQRMESYRKIIENIFELICNRYRIIINSNCAIVLAKIIYKCTYIDKSDKDWENKNKKNIDDMLRLVMSCYKEETSIVLEIEDMITKTMDIELNSMNAILLILNIHFYSKRKKVNKILGLVMERGYSTASSIADSANKIIGQPVFEAIDLPLDINEDDMVDALKRYMDNRNYYEEAIILADISFSENTEKILSSYKNIHLGIVNVVSTRAAIKIGSMMLAGMEMKKILKSAVMESNSQYKIYKNKKKDAVIFTTEMGTLSTDRVISVFKSSIPKNIDICFIPYDYYALAKGGIDEPIFDEYNVLMITGTCKVEIKDIPYMAIEDVIAFEDIGKINKIFSRYLDESEMRTFNDNLIRNFSLQNIMQSLTILNAKSLLEYIESSILNLQRSLGISLTNKIKLRLYMHISTLIERLVTKEPMIQYPGLEDFENNQSDFIKYFRESFKEVCSNYNVEIPLSEIAYLHDYMFDN